MTSADVYGHVASNEMPITEERSLAPVSPYAASKAAADLIALQAFNGYDQNVIRIRAFNHFGPGQSENFVSAAIACRVARNELSGEKIVKIGNLEAKRDFTDVRDVVAAYRLLSLSGKPGEAYNVCSGSATSIKEIAEKIVDLAEHEMEFEIDEKLFGDSTKLIETTGWKPEFSLEDTLNDLLEFWRVQVLLERQAE